MDGSESQSLSLRRSMSLIMSESPHGLIKRLRILRLIKRLSVNLRTAGAENTAQRSRHTRVRKPSQLAWMQLALQRSSG